MVRAFSIGTELTHLHNAISSFICTTQSTDLSEGWSIPNSSDQTSLNSQRCIHREYKLDSLTDYHFHFIFLNAARIKESQRKDYIHFHAGLGPDLQGRRDLSGKGECTPLRSSRVTANKSRPVLISSPEKRATRETTERAGASYSNHYPQGSC